MKNFTVLQSTELFNPCFFAPHARFCMKIHFVPENVLLNYFINIIDIKESFRLNGITPISMFVNKTTRS